MLTWTLLEKKSLFIHATIDYCTKSTNATTINLWRKMTNDLSSFWKGLMKTCVWLAPHKMNFCHTLPLAKFRLPRFFGRDYNEACSTFCQINKQGQISVQIMDFLPWYRHQSTKILFNRQVRCGARHLNENLVDECFK